jgi:hypothetical protein
VAHSDWLCGTGMAGRGDKKSCQYEWFSTRHAFDSRKAANGGFACELACPGQV